MKNIIGTRRTFKNKSKHWSILVPVLYLSLVVTVVGILLFAVSDRSRRIDSESDAWGSSQETSSGRLASEFRCENFIFPENKLVFSLGESIPVQYVDQTKPHNIKVYFADTFEGVPDFTKSNIMNWREVPGNYDVATGTFNGTISNFQPDNNGKQTELLLVANVEELPGGEICSGNPIFSDAPEGFIPGTNPRKPCTGCQALVVIDGNAVGRRAATEDLVEYWNLNPGNYWMYEGKNYSYPGPTTNGQSQGYESFLSRIDIENTISFCGHLSNPMRFTKNNSYGYWGPRMSWQPENAWSGPYARRWFPTAFYEDADWNGTQFMGSLGGKSYLLNGGENWTKELGEFWPNNQVFFATPKQNFYYPPYLISPRTIELGSGTLFSFHRNDRIITGSRFGLKTENQSICEVAPDSWMITAKGIQMIGIEKDHGWWLDIKTVPVTTAQYSGDALRYRFVEYTNPMGSGFILREDWYFAKGIGLVRADAKDISHYFQGSNALTLDTCKQTDMCLNKDVFDSSNPPDATMTLTQYFPLQELTAEVSRDGVNWNQNTVLTSQSDNWFVKLSSNYTGWVDVLSSNDQQDWQTTEKWGWAENGVIQRTVPSTLRPDTYYARFRPHILKSRDPNETLLSVRDAPWSNTILNEVLFVSRPR